MSERRHAIRIALLSSIALTHLAAVPSSTARAQSRSSPMFFDNRRLPDMEVERRNQEVLQEQRRIEDERHQTAEAAAKRLAEEAAAKKKTDEARATEAQRKAAEDKRLAGEAEAKKQADEAAAKAAAAAAEAQRKAEDDKRKADEERQRQAAADANRKAEEARLTAEAEAKKRADEAVKAAAAEAQRKADDEKRRLAADAEAKKRADEAAKAAAAEAQRKAEDEKRRLAAEAEVEARRKAELARIASAEEAQRKAADQARAAEAQRKAASAAAAAAAPPPPSQQQTAGLIQSPANTAGQVEARGGGCDGVKAQASYLPAGRLHIAIASPCHKNEPVQVAYGGFDTLQKLNASGQAAFDVDLIFANTQPVVLTYAGGQSETINPAAADLSDISKVALIWSAPVDLALHALENGAAAGSPGDVWRGTAASAETAKAKAADSGRGAGFISQAGDGSREGTKIEVYTFYHSADQPNGVVSMLLDYTSRGNVASGDFCGGGSKASVTYDVIMTSRKGAVSRERGVISPAACGTKFTPADRLMRDAVPDLQFGP